MSQLPAKPAASLPAVNRTEALQRLAVILTPLCAAFPMSAYSQASPEDRAPILATYAEALRGHTPSAIEAAVFRHMRDPKDGRWWPSPAHLLRFLPRKPSEETPPAADLDAAAWEHIEEQLRISPADRSVRELLPHQRRAFYRVTGGFRSRGGFGKEEANEARNWPFLKRRFLQICAESPATPEDLLPPVEPVRLTLEQMLAAEKEHDARQAARQAAEDARRATLGATAAPSVVRSAPKRPGAVQRPRMSDAEVTRRSLEHADMVARLEAERAAFTPCDGCIMPGLDDAPGCREGATCERELRAARVRA